MTTMTTPLHRQITSGEARRGGADQNVNVSDLERWLSVLGGGALAVYGLSRRDLPGVGCAVAGGSLLYMGLTGHCAAYSALGINTAEQHNPIASVAANRGVKIVRAITVNRPPAEVYRAWRNFEQLPHFMQHLKEVSADGCHWTAKAPAGMHVSWEAEIINDQPNRLIAWRSLAGSHVSTAGSVHFTPTLGGQGTEVLVELKYDPPAGKLGAWLASLFGQEPSQQLRADLQRFKEMMESGRTTATAPRQPAYQG